MKKDVFCASLVLFWSPLGAGILQTLLIFSQFGADGRCATGQPHPYQETPKDVVWTLRGGSWTPLTTNWHPLGSPGM